MKVLLVIPARGGSKGIHRKNLVEINGRPLISYALENALNAHMVDTVIVSTEDSEIASVAKTYGAEVPFIRPSELAEDAISIIPVIIHALHETEKQHKFFDIIVSLQPTAPLIRPDTIDQGIQLLEETGCDSVSSVKLISHSHPYRAYSMDNTGCMSSLIPDGETFLQRQDLPDFYTLTGGLYVRWKKTLQDWSGRDFCLGTRKYGLRINNPETLNIDNELDLLLFKMIIENKGM